MYMAWSELGILLAVALVLCAIGFKNFVWFLSIGYGLAIFGIGLTLLIQGAAGTLTFSAGFTALALLLMVYGARLSGFLIYRQVKSASYKKALTGIMKTAAPQKKMPLFVSILIWLSVGLLYVAQTSPVIYRGVNGTSKGWIVGFLISVIGLIIETAADLEKSAYKKENPNLPAMKGLYKMVRCPNYFGEILFWTGILVSGFTALKGAGQWIIAIVGYILIVFVMFNGAQRLEKRHNKNYGHLKEYREYADHTPIIIPLVPLYHLTKE